MAKVLGKLFLSIIIITATFQPSIAKDSSYQKITILHTNDSHGRVFGGLHEGLGFAKIATLAKQFKEENENTLLLDAGDALHGTTFATIDQGESIIRVMDVVGYDGMTVGNHDFNYGRERLLELVQMANFPVISANLLYEITKKPLLLPYIIKEMNGLKVGIFGLSTPETIYKTNAKNVEGVLFTDPVAAAEKSVKELKANGVNAVIAISHLGTNPTSQHTSLKVAQEVSGIDLIVDGHSHSKGATMVEKTLIVSAGEYTKRLGVVELNFRSGKLMNKKASYVIDSDAIIPDTKVTSVIQDILKEQEKQLKTVIGKTNVVLVGDRERVRKGETNLGNLIADAMLEETGADIALLNGGGIRASIDQGDITKGDVITVLPFGNYIMTKVVSGKTVKEALENGVRAYPERSGAFPHVAGMTFAFDPSNPFGDRVDSVQVAGEPLELDKEYIIAMSDFLASGGDQYTMFTDIPVKNEFATLSEVLMNFIKKQGEVNPKQEKRVRIEKE
ncbi:5'-nucleotidase C-terminal domain-containing protein [Bacillus carboniphilus]|uniref:5'-nucleotidase C-terminal domain-containing protein n=1 Tax=Bacillus carboniphilus TaxID=86663 RepID=A0ABP3G8W1_9BACI